MGDRCLLHAGRTLDSFVSQLESWSAVASDFGVPNVTVDGYSYCTWTTFVKCGPNHQIRELNISYDVSTPPFPQNPLRGNLTAGLGDLHSLTSLRIFNHSILGVLPAEWGKPGAFPALKTL